MLLHNGSAFTINHHNASVTMTNQLFFGINQIIESFLYINPCQRYFVEILNFIVYFNHILSIPLNISSIKVMRRKHSSDVSAIHVEKDGAIPIPTHQKKELHHE